MNAVSTPHGAPDDGAATGLPAYETDGAVLSALLKGLNEVDTSFVRDALHRAQQAVRDADERGEAPPQPVW